MLSMIRELPPPRMSRLVTDFLSASAFDISLLSMSMLELSSPPFLEHPSDASVAPKTPVKNARAARATWTEQERVRLRALYEEHHPVAEIAELMNRTVRAVGTMVLRLGLNQHKAPPSWTVEECNNLLRLHAQGISWAAIAAALPERSAVAIYRKLRHLVGPAPFSVEPSSPASAPEIPPQTSVPQLSATQGPVQAPSNDEPPKAAGLARLTLVAKAEAPRPVVVRPEPTPPVVASAEAMVRWLRSRDFMVIRQGSGWRVDQCELADDSALLEFANIRRARLRLPVFLLSNLPPVVPEIAPVRARVWR